MSGSAISRSVCHRTRTTVSAHRGSLRVSYRADDSGEPRVLYAVPKSVGTAVARNRARRRVREALRELARDGTVMLGAGEYRLAVHSRLRGLSASELRATVSELLKDVHR